MGWPHPTVEVPGVRPDIAAELSLIGPDPLGLVSELRHGMIGMTATPGHVCATAFVVTPDRTRLLLVQHPRLGWSNPGGHLMVGECTQDAVERELEEETGLTAADLTLIGHGPVAVHVTDIDDDRPHRHWNVAWAYEASPDVVLTPEDGAPVRWFDVSALPSTDVAADLLDTWGLVSREITAS